jgi:hypothetical protein
MDVFEVNGQHLLLAVCYLLLEYQASKWGEILE